MDVIRFKQKRSGTSQTQPHCMIHQILYREEAHIWFYCKYNF